MKKFRAEVKIIVRAVQSFITSVAHQRTQTLTMASNFRLQKPYVLTALPKLLDQATGQYVVGEVYGTSEGSRKRKRPEVTVGIDGEAVNIYDVCNSRALRLCNMLTGRQL